MNTPYLSETFSVEGHTPLALGTSLFEAAQRKEIALSDARGCADTLRFYLPGLTRSEWRAARRVAIDLQGQAARSPDTRLLSACRTALARAEKIAEHATSDEAHTALAEISDLLASALAGDPAPS